MRGGSHENEDPENEDLRPPTKTKTPYENEDPCITKTKTPYENEDL